MGSQIEFARQVLERFLAEKRAGRRPLVDREHVVAHAFLRGWRTIGRRRSTHMLVRYSPTPQRSKQSSEAVGRPSDESRSQSRRVS